MLILKKGASITKASFFVAPVLLKRQLLSSNMPLLYFNINNLRGKTITRCRKTIYQRARGTFLMMTGSVKKRGDLGVTANLRK